MSGRQGISEEVRVAHAEMRWAVKPSLVTYVKGSGGHIAPKGGARVEEDEYVFPLAEARQLGDATNSRLLCFRGEIRFLAHGGLMDIAIRDPWIQVAGGTRHLSLSTGHTNDPPGRLVLAELEVDTCSGSMRIFNVFLSLTGATVFDSNYQAGTALAPLTLVECD